MKECPLCLNEVTTAGAEKCPACGTTLVASGNLARAPSTSQVPRIDWDLFQSRLQQRGVTLEPEDLARIASILHLAEGSCRRATILVVDLYGYPLPPSPFGRGAGGERSTRAEFNSLCATCILRHGGLPLEFVGDALVAVFGAPVAFDPDALAAAQAAADIRSHAATAEAAGDTLRFRIGLSSGPCIFGQVATPAGRVPHVGGVTVEQALRLQQLAEPNEILTCSSTRTSLARSFHLEEAPTPNLQSHGATPAFRLLAPREHSEWVHASSTPFQGRSAELVELTAFLSGTQGARHVLHLVGEAGIGKSRLLTEALRALEAPHATVRLEAPAQDTDVPLHPVVRWLRRQMDLPLDASPGLTRNAIGALFRDQFPDSLSGAVLVEHLFGVPEAIALLQGVPAERVSDNLRHLLREMLVALGRRSGRCLVVADDAPLYDPATLELLRSLAARSPDPSLRLVLVRRTDQEPPVAPTPDHLTLNLAPLDNGDRKALLSALVPTAEFLAEFRDAILQKAGGNPLFIEEMTRLVREVVRTNSVLKGDETRNNILDVIPASLTELIQARIDKLDAQSRHVLDCISILGLEFSLQLVELFDDIGENLAEHLSILRAHKYLDHAQEKNGGVFSFRHGMYRDVAYWSQTEEQRRTLHAKLASRLEEALAGRLANYYDVLCHHYSLAGNPEKAIYYQVKVADRQAALGASRTALASYENAISLLRQQPATPPLIALMTRLGVSAARLYREAGENEAADELLTAAVGAARSIGNPALELEARLELAVSEVWRGGDPTVVDRLRELDEEAARANHTAARLVALNAIGVHGFRSGQLEEALSAFQKAAVLAEKANVPHLLADAFNNAGLIYWRWGEFPQAIRAFRRALPLRRKTEDRPGLAATLMNMGIIYEQLGRVRAAHSAYNHAVSIARQLNLIQILAAGECNLSNLARRMGSPLAACEHAHLAIAFSREAGDRSYEAVAEENAALGLLEREDLESASPHLDRAFALAVEVNDREREVSVRLSRLELGLKRGVPEEAAMAEVDTLLKVIAEGHLSDFEPRASRIKGELIERGAVSSGGEEALTYLEGSYEKARGQRNLFEMADSLRALVAWAVQHGVKDRLERWRSERESLMRTLEIAWDQMPGGG